MATSLTKSRIYYASPEMTSERGRRGSAAAAEDPIGPGAPRQICLIGYDDQHRTQLQNIVSPEPRRRRPDRPLAGDPNIVPPGEERRLCDARDMSD
jgi:hypothetical protein